MGGWAAASVVALAPFTPHTTTTLSGPIWFDSVRFGYLGVVVIAVADVDGRAEVDDARERTVGLL